METRVIRLEGDIEEDVVGELENFVKHSKFGIYTVAREIFAQALEPHKAWFPVAAEFAEMLLEQGDFRALESFATEVSEPWYAAFHGAELELFRLYRAMARIHTAGLLKEALQETGNARPPSESVANVPDQDFKGVPEEVLNLEGRANTLVEDGRKPEKAENAMVYVSQTTNQGPDDVQIQIQILRLKILDLGYRTSSFVSGLDFGIPWRGPSLESPWKGYYTWYTDLVSKDRQWEAQVILGLYGDRGAQSVEHITAHLNVQRPTIKSDERVIVACYGLASVLFTSLAKLVWNGKNLDERGRKNAENYLAVMEACIKALGSSAQGTRLHQMVTLLQLDFLAMSVASKARAMDADMDAKLERFRDGLLQILNQAEITNDYVLQLETMWRMPLVFKLRYVFFNLQYTLEKWKRSGDIANYLILVHFLYEIRWLTNKEVDIEAHEKIPLTVKRMDYRQEGGLHFMIPEVNRIAQRLETGLQRPKIEDLPHPRGNSRHYASQLFLHSLQGGFEGIAPPIKPTQGRQCFSLIEEYMMQHNDVTDQAWSNF